MELYDGNAANSALRFVNLSTRTRRDDGQRLIVGVTISGRQQVRILVRAVGTTLTSFGLDAAHPDPDLRTEEVSEKATRIAKAYRFRIALVSYRYRSRIALVSLELRSSAVLGSPLLRTDRG